MQVFDGAPPAEFKVVKELDDALKKVRYRVSQSVAVWCSVGVCSPCVQWSGSLTTRSKRFPENSATSTLFRCLGWRTLWRAQMSRGTAGTFWWGTACCWIRRSSAMVWGTWLVRERDMTHSYVWHDSFICVMWLISACDMSVTGLIHMFDTTHSYVRHDLFICGTWLIHMCDVTRSCVWRDSFICVMWLIHMCDVTRSYV